MRRQACVLLGMFLLALGQWRCGNSGAGEAADPSPASPAAAAELAVKVAPVAVMDWQVAIPISGSLRSLSNVDIRSEVGGRLLAAHFQEGNQVRKDEVLAEIDPVNHRLARDQANAALSVAQAGLERIQVALDYARRERERADNLLRTGGITEKDHQAAVNGVKEAETQVRLAEAQIGQARAAVTIAEKALSDCTILAPADGQVRRKYLDAGSLLTPGTSVYSLVDNSRLELECLVPSYQLAGVRTGQRVEFTTPTWEDRVFSGTVLAINPMVESDNRSIKVLVKIANPGGELRSGMFASGEIDVRVERRAVVIPRSALMVESGTFDSGSVFVVSGGRAVRRQVRISGARRDLLWTSQGLAEGDQVIVDIGPSLKDGAPVRVLQETPAEGR